MQILNQFPPNIEQIREKFPLAKFNPVFTYGDTLYNPTGLRVSDDLIKHEEVHAEQQKLYQPDIWWKKYFEDVGFRMEQELAAYRKQFAYIKETQGRQQRRRWLDELAKNFSSVLYGKIITKKEAKELIDV